MTDPNALQQAIMALHAGQLIAYPTEGVYGVGCDPYHEQAVKSLCALKQRSLNKGLILIAAQWSMVAPLTAPIAPQTLKKIFTQWPGPTTWVFPASDKAPPWICGNHKSIALRLTDHPIAQALSTSFGKALVSTSANPQGQPPALDSAKVQHYFTNQLDCIVEGALGDLKGPTPIWDALTLQPLR